MKYYWLLPLAVAVVLSASACGKQESSVGVIGGGDLVSGEAQLPSAPTQPKNSSSGAQENASGEESASAEAVSTGEYEAYLKKYVVPYGSLKFYDKDWTNAEDLSADRIFEFTLQKNFNFYNSIMDYADVFGEEFTYLQVPEKWYDESNGLVCPQDIIENAAIEYFGVDAAFLRTAKAYLPAKNGYIAPLLSAPEDGDTPTTELLPEVIGVTRSGKRAAITFTLTPCDFSGKPTGGDVLTRVMVVEDKEETFRYVSVKAS